MNWTTRSDSPVPHLVYPLPEYRTVRVRLLRPLMFDGKRREPGEVIKVIEPDALDLIATKRAERIS